MRTTVRLDGEQMCDSGRPGRGGAPRLAAFHRPDVASTVESDREPPDRGALGSALLDELPVELRDALFEALPVLIVDPGLEALFDRSRKGGTVSGLRKILGAVSAELPPRPRRPSSRGQGPETRSSRHAEQVAAGTSALDGATGALVLQHAPFDLESRGSHSCPGSSRRSLPRAGSAHRRMEPTLRPARRRCPPRSPMNPRSTTLHLRHAAQSRAPPASKGTRQGQNGRYPLDRKTRCPHTRHPFTVAYLEEIPFLLPGRLIAIRRFSSMFNCMSTANPQIHRDLRFPSPQPDGSSRSSAYLRQEGSPLQPRTSRDAECAPLPDVAELPASPPATEQARDPGSSWRHAVLGLVPVVS
jgi:hypothetical protein